MAQADYVTNAIRALITDASPKPSTNPIRAAWAGFIADLAGHRALSMPLNPYAVDLEDRTDRLRKVPTAVSAYLTAILHETANLPGRITLRHVDTLLSDVIGTFQHAAVSMAARRVS